MGLRSEGGSRLDTRVPRSENSLSKRPVVGGTPGTPREGPEVYRQRQRPSESSSHRPWGSGEDLWRVGSRRQLLTSTDVLAGRQTGLGSQRRLTQGAPPCREPRVPRLENGQNSRWERSLGDNP